MPTSVKIPREDDCAEEGRDGGDDYKGDVSVGVSAAEVAFIV